MRLLASIALLLLVATASAAGALDEETGCTKYANYVTCPQFGELTDTAVRFDTDTTCRLLQNEYGDMEEIICDANATLLEDADFKECEIYVPFDPVKGEILSDKVNKEYNCIARHWASGETITVHPSEEMFSGCVKTEGNAAYEFRDCATKGVVATVGGGASQLEGKRLFVYTLEREQAFIDATTLTIATVILGIVMIFIFRAWDKRKGAQMYY